MGYGRGDKVEVVWGESEVYGRSWVAATVMSAGKDRWGRPAWVVEYEHEKGGMDVVYCQDMRPRMAIAEHDGNDEDEHHYDDEDGEHSLPLTTAKKKQRLDETEDEVDLSRRENWSIVAISSDKALLADGDEDGEHSLPMAMAKKKRLDETEKVVDLTRSENWSIIAISSNKAHSTSSHGDFRLGWLQYSTCRNATLPWQFTSVKLSSTPVQMASGDCEHGHDRESSAAKMLKEPQQLEVVPVGSEHASVTKMTNVSGETNYGAFKKVIARRRCIKICAKKKRSEKQRGPNSSLDATRNQFLTTGIHANQLDEGLTGTIDSSSQDNRNEDGHAATQVPFIKASPVWSMFEQMELFKKMPQRPHFGPLQEEPHLLRREGMAIELMVTYENVVKTIRKSSIEDSDRSFKDTNSELSRLKVNGFNVENLQTCLDELIDMKSEYTKHLEEVDVVQTDMLSHRTSFSEVNSLLAKEMESVIKLEKKLVRRRKKVEQLMKNKVHVERRLLNLEVAEREVKKQLYVIKRKYGSTVAQHVG